MGYAERELGLPAARGKRTRTAAGAGASTG